MQLRAVSSLAVPNDRLAPGECIPWSAKRREIESIPGDEQLCRDVWQRIDGLGNMFIWQCLLSF